MGICGISSSKEVIVNNCEVDVDEELNNLNNNKDQSKIKGSKHNSNKELNKEQIGDKKDQKNKKKILKNSDSNKDMFNSPNTKETKKVIKFVETSQKDKSSEKLNLNEETEKKAAFKRRARAFKSVKEPQKVSKDIKEAITNNEDKKVVRRRNKKSVTLIEKTKLGNKIFEEEMKIPILQETLIHEQKGHPRKKYKTIKKLGVGSYGSVYQAKNIATGNIIAMKMIEKVKENEIDDMEIQNEINILKKLGHPNIVKIYEFYNTLTDYFIITEFCKEGELFSYIKLKFSEKQLAVLFYQVFSGLCYLHENNILHRDLKLENIMISEKEKDIVTGEEYFWIKIIDFGTAKIFEHNRAERTVVGSSYYIAPEVLEQKYNEKCDTWSAGVILYMTLVGKAPFDGKTDEDIIRKIESENYNKNEPRLLNRSKEARDLVSKLLEKKIHKRLSAKEALLHPWFEKFGGRTLFCNFKPEELTPYIENLFNYKYQSKLQQLVLAFLVHNIPNSSDTLFILKMFRYFNEAGDCKLTKVELTTGLYKYREQKEVDECVDNIFLLLDGDNNGYIEFEEFLRACISKKTIFSKHNLEYAFKFLDQENKGTLDVQSILKAFVTVKNDMLEKILENTIKEVDTEQKGYLNFEQFSGLMQKVE